jgi:hypothetical protein
MIGACWIAPGILRRCYRPRGPRADGAIVAPGGRSRREAHVATNADYDRLLRIVEKVVANQKLLAEGLARAHGVELDLADAEDSVWETLLEEHPELRDWIMEGGTCVDGINTYPTRYHYYGLRGSDLDSLVIAAMRRGGPEGMTSREILVAMYGTLDEATASDGDREEAASVPNRLWPLTLQGLVERVRVRHGSTPALWRLKEGDDA